MMMCSVCKENYAVVFVTKVINGKQTQEGLCLSCAKKQGIQPINQLIEQTGMTDEDIDNLNKQVGNMFDNMDIDNLNNEPTNPDNALSGQKQLGEGNPFFSFLNKAFPKNQNSIESPEEQHKDAQDDKETRNTRTKTQEKKNAKKKKYLDMYGSNLTDLAREDKIDRVIGRQKEIDRVIQILNRRTKNNPVLIGEPGVGKTAIAEGLAVRIVKRQVPAKLFNIEVYLLDLTSVSRSGISAAPCLPAVIITTGDLKTCWPATCSGSDLMLGIQWKLSFASFHIGLFSAKKLMPMEKEPALQVCAGM
jgi:ATP-dependent Clp protease ATP-binding subunit ClpE